MTKKRLETQEIGLIGEIILIYLLEREGVYSFDLEMLFPQSFPERKKIGERIHNLRNLNLIKTGGGSTRTGSVPVYMLTELGKKYAEYFHNDEINENYPRTIKLLAAYMASENPLIKTKFKEEKIERILEDEGMNLLESLADTDIHGSS